MWHKEPDGTSRWEGALVGPQFYTGGDEQGEELDVEAYVGF